MTPQSINLLKAVLDASLQASLVILLILLLRPLLGACVPAKWRSWLWMLVLVRLLVPAFLLPPNPASLQNLPVVQQPVERAELALDLIYANYSLVETRRPQLSSDSISAPSAPPMATVVKKPFVVSWWQIAFFVWIGGALFFGLFVMAASLRLRRHLSCEEEKVTEEIARLWRACGTRVGAKILPRLRATRLISSPALFGLMRPVLLIPSSALTTFSREEWEHIFLHELAHLARRDHWTQGLQLVALGLHWFNPLVWLGLRALRADRELAADEWALRYLPDEQAYGQTLLRVLTTGEGNPLRFAGVGIMEDTSQMKQRLRRIAAFSRGKILGTILGVAVTTVIALLALGRQTGKVDLTDYTGLSNGEILAVAAGHGDLPIIKWALAQGTDINTKLPGQKIPLVAAADANQLAAVQLLIARGATLNPSENRTAPAVMGALLEGSRKTLDYLLAKGAVCAPSVRAAAAGDDKAIDTFLASDPPDFNTLKNLAEVAAASGQAKTFARLCDAIRKLPGQSNWSVPVGTLARAVAQGHRDVAEEAIKRGAAFDLNNGVARLSEAAARSPGMREWLATKDIEVPDISDSERLIGAAEREDLPEMRRLLRASANVNFLGERGWTPLTKAATWGKPKAVKLLLESGADPNLVKGYDYTALSLAATSEIADMLFAAGAEINLKRGNAHQVWYAMQQGNDAVVKWYRDHGVNLAKVDHYDGSALFVAGSPQIAQWAIADGADVNAKNKFGQTALFETLSMNGKKNATEVARVLLEHGADPNARDSSGRTPIMEAKDGPAVDLLVKYGADLQAKDDRGNGVAGAIICDPKSSRYEALRRHGVVFDVKTDAPMMASRAILDHATARFQELLAQGLDPNADADSGMRQRRDLSLLSLAISFGTWDIVDALRAAGANTVGTFTETVARGALAKIQELIDAGADINERDSMGSTPLIYAARRVRVDVVKLLIERGADVNLFTFYGVTPLTLADMGYQNQKARNFGSIEGLSVKEELRGMEEIITLLKGKKPDINARNARGETALHAAAANGGGVTGLLLGQGADPNVQRDDSMTPLMLAIVNQPKDPPMVITSHGKDGQPETKYSDSGFAVNQLLTKGADLQIKNKAGQTALDLARQNGNAEILGLLAQKTTPH